MTHSGRPRHGHKGGSLALDKISFASFGAYSYSRKLRAAYSGAAFKVRRLSNGDELDIGFSGNLVDLAAVLSFCSGTVGYVSAAYDQGLTARHATMATLAWQPRICTGGVVDKMSNGVAAMYFPTAGSNMGLGTPDGPGLGFSGDVNLTVGFSFARHSGEDRLWMIGKQGETKTNVCVDAEVTRGMFVSNFGSGSGYRAMGYTTTADVPHSMILKKAAGAPLSAWVFEEGGTNLSQIGLVNGTQTASLSATARVVLGNDTFFSDSPNGWFASWIGFNALLTGNDLTALRTELAQHA